MWAASVLSARRNFRRAGTLKKRSFTSTTVPGAQPASRTSRITPPSTAISVPATDSRSRVISRKRETLAMLQAKGLPGVSLSVTQKDGQAKGQSHPEAQ